MTELSIAPTVPAPEAALAELRHEVLGPVHGPGDLETVTELAGFNLAVEHAPVAVLGATSSADVAAGVRWAARHGLPVGVVATGHSDWSHRDGLVISTRRLDSVTVDAAARTATVGAGVKWARVIEAAAPYGLAGLVGSSSDVGVVGYTLGGGSGPFLRTLGYASDRVRRMEVVTGDGAIRSVTPASDSELFAAMLGGKDVVGIVTEMEFELVEIAGFYGGAMFYDAADIPAVLHLWREWAPSLPEEATTSVAIMRLPDMEMLPPPLRGRTVAHLRVAHVGDAASGEELLAPMRAVATPIMDTVGEMPFAAVDGIHMDPPQPVPGWVTGQYLSDVTAETVDALLAAAGPQQQLPIAMVDLRLIDGAAARSTGAHGHAGARFTVGLVAPMLPELRETAPVVGQGVVDALVPWSTGRIMPNWAGPASMAARPGAAWTDAERERIAAVATRVGSAGVLGGHRFGL